MRIMFTEATAAERLAAQRDTAAARVVAARQRVADAATLSGIPEGERQHFTSWEEAGRAALILAEAEGALSIYEVAASLARQVADGTTVLPVDSIADALEAMAIRRLSAHPDDVWSGRLNDARRAYHDGVRAAAVEFIRHTPTY